MFTTKCQTCQKELILPWKETVCSQCRLTTEPVTLPEPLTGAPYTDPQIRNLTDYYIYLWWIDPIPYPVYIGKGTGSRYSAYHEADPRQKRTPSWAQQVREQNRERFRVTIHRAGMAEPHAYALEQYLIHEAVANGHQLLNRSAGGGTATDAPAVLSGDVPSVGLMAYLLGNLPRNRTLLSVEHLTVDGSPFTEHPDVAGYLRHGMIRLQGNYAAIPDAARLKKLCRVPDARKTV